MNPSEFFSSVNSPVAALRLWLVWIGMAFFVAAIASLLYDRSQARRLSYVTYGLIGALAIVLVFIFLPRIFG